MSRPLPLAGPAPEPTRPAAEAPAAAPLRGRVEVCDPAMCCPTGLCGPGVDPALLAISRDLRWLERRGVSVVRVGLATEPDAFVAGARLAGLLQAFGDSALPATLVNGAVLAHGRYPTRAELVDALAARAWLVPWHVVPGCAPSRVSHDGPRPTAGHPADRVVR